MAGVSERHEFRATRVATQKYNAFVPGKPWAKAFSILQISQRPSTVWLARQKRTDRRKKEENKIKHHLFQWKVEIQKKAIPLSYYIIKEVT